jgi:hypothetical protein
MPLSRQTCLLAAADGYPVETLKEDLARAGMAAALVDGPVLQSWCMQALAG